MFKWGREDVEFGEQAMDWGAPKYDCILTFLPDGDDTNDLLYDFPDKEHVWYKADDCLVSDSDDDDEEVSAQCKCPFIPPAHWLWETESAARAYGSGLDKTQWKLFRVRAQCPWRWMSHDSPKACSFATFYVIDQV